MIAIRSCCTRQYRTTIWINKTDVSNTKVIARLHSRFTTMTLLLTSSVQKSKFGPKLVAVFKFVELVYRKRLLSMFTFIIGQVIGETIFPMRWFTQKSGDSYYFFIMNYEKLCFQIIFNQAKFTIIMSIVEFSSICWRPSIYSSAFISDFYSSLFVSSHFRTARRMTFIAVIVSFIMSYHYP